MKIEPIDKCTTELKTESVYNLLKDCMFRESEIKDGLPTKEFTFVQGIARKYVLSTERLNENKKIIAEIIDMLQVSEFFPQSFLCLCYDKHNNLWTGEQKAMEVIVALGIACGLIEYAYPREKWGELAGSVPIVIRTKKDINKPVVGEPPEVFSKYVTKEEIKEQEETKQDCNQINVLAKETFNAHYKKAAPILGMLGYSMVLEGEIYYLYDNKGEKLCELNVGMILDGFTYEGVVNDTRVRYAYSRDGVNSDGGLIYRNIVTVDNIQEQDAVYSGKQVKIELGMGLHEVSEVSRVEVTIIEPGSDEKITQFYVSPYDLSLKIRNNFGPYGNYENGTTRSVHYTDTSITPYVNCGALLLHESQAKGNGYNISIDRENTYPATPAKYSHRATYFTLHTPEVEKYSFEGRVNANNLACEYLKTSRVKNLYNHILNHIDAEVNGMKDFIHTNYPLTESLEKIMIQTPASTQEELVNSFAIKDANVPSENGKNAKKYSKQN